MLDLGYSVDEDTGRKRRIQKWLTVQGTKREADARLLDTAVKPPDKRLRSYETDKSVVSRHIKPALGGIRLQQLRPTDIKRYYDGSKLSASTLEPHHTIIHSAHEAAQMQGLVQRNAASLVVGKPHAKERHEEILENCWEAPEARRLLAAAEEAGPQPAAFYTLALDTGARKAELRGLKWSEVNLEAGRVSIVRQFVNPGPEPVFGPPKNGIPRTITVAPETAALLRRHNAHQTQVKLANRAHYRDHGLVFAKEWEDVRRQRDTPGDPLQMNNMGQREFLRLVNAAGVRRIKFHGLRHTYAALMLQAGVPIKVVQQHLGHKRIEITLGTYAHALPSMQQDAAAKLASILHA